MRLMAVPTTRTHERVQRARAPHLESERLVRTIATVEARRRTRCASDSVHGGSLRASERAGFGSRLARVGVARRRMPARQLSAIFRREALETLMAIVLFIVFGFIVGLIARALMP